MIRKLKLWWLNRTNKAPGIQVEQKLYTYEQARAIAEEYGNLRYQDGKRDGLAIAREQAQNSLKEILRQQNNVVK